MGRKLTDGEIIAWVYKKKQNVGKQNYTERCDNISSNRVHPSPSHALTIMRMKESLKFVSYHQCVKILEI